jgi:hypothetical protein
MHDLPDEWFFLPRRPARGPAGSTDTAQELESLRLCSPFLGAALAYLPIRIESQEPGWLEFRSILTFLIPQIYFNLIEGDLFFEESDPGPLSERASKRSNDIPDQFNSDVRS